MNTGFNSNFDRTKQYSRNLKVAFKPRVLVVLVSALMSKVAMADNAMPTELNEPVPTVTLDKITVLATQSKEATQATEDIKTNQDIRDHQIDTLQDLVRYNTDISVAEIGRYGNKGFAIRGVDGNRVALTLDGVNLPDRQVNEVFSRYGKLYEGRFSPDLEILSEARIQVGADSFKSGSGAVGGAVNYKTKDPTDLVEHGEQMGGYAKLGYSDRNEEWTTAVGIAGINDRFEGIINYVRRDGHELKNHKMVGFKKEKLDPSYDFSSDPDYPNTYPKEASLPDPLDYQSDAVLAKLYYHLNDDHRVGVQGIYQKRDSLSNNYSTRIASYKNPPAKIGMDSTELKGYGINYRYLPMDSQFIDEIRADLSRQEIEAIAHTEEFRFRDGVYNWEEKDHRPQIDKVTQFRTEGKLLPLQSQHLGTHNISLDAKFAKLDHDLILQSTAKDFSSYDDNYKIGHWNTFVGPAVKTDVFNVAISDTINFTDKLSTTLGLRYDNFHYKPYMTPLHLGSIKHYSGEAAVKKFFENGDFSKKRRMDNVGGMVALNYELTPQWQLGYKYSTGFNAPSSSQMYSAFQILGNTLTPNPNLEPEKSKNHELTIAANYDNFSANLTGFYTDYDDFIQVMNYPSKEGWRTVNLIAAKNIGKAETYGARLGGTWDLSELAQTSGSVRLSGNVSYAKDKTDKGINLLATEPPSAQLGLHYESADKDYRVNASARYLGAKKAEDAKVYADTNRKPYGDAAYGIAPYEYIDKSESTVVYDVYGSKKLGKGLTLSAGIYNVFDEEYFPWSNLRSIAEINLNTSLGRNGEGIERYTAPGRNYKVGLTYEF